MLLSGFWTAKFHPAEFPTEYRDLIATLTQRCSDIDSDNSQGLTPRGYDHASLSIPDDMALLAKWPSDGRMGPDFNTSALAVV